jgi:hypothetical protein
MGVGTPIEELRHVAWQARSYVKATACACSAIPGGICWHCLFDNALAYLDAADACKAPFATVDGFYLSKLSLDASYICPEDALLKNACLHINLAVLPLLISVNGQPPAEEANVKAGDVIRLERSKE